MSKWYEIPTEFPVVEASNKVGYLHESGVVTITAVQTLWHDVLVGLTGINENLVRLAEQIDPPPTPGRDENWLAYFVRSGMPARNYPDVTHVDTEDGHSLVIEYKREDVTVYCYGPLSSDYADRVRRGLHITQNRDQLFLSGIGIQQIGAPLQVPTLQNQKWYQRHDITINTLRRTVARFEILNILEAGAVIKADKYNDQGKRVYSTACTLRVVVDKEA